VTLRRFKIKNLQASSWIHFRISCHSRDCVLP